MTSAEKSEEAATPPPREAVGRAAGFVGEHGGSARAVVENLGRAGARIVLIGQDGAFGDMMVSDVATGRSVVDAVDNLTDSAWDNETTSALRIDPEHRRRMGRTRG
ncbi:hypothetical protein FHX42_000951 [Saccharopolyspora lacisalsi]|uniref:Uncharacterized protein n=1 Tax=Halosaccharopolyspora lacisalsi TaxID=1000566 RepID=A0A839DNS2_9PSEU|nr:hypothetical protein [Halosaccharopolyspora lacisalsi]MBA8823622.1 hypothetical protein [Halosaccharopolyspora lacisalsi]